ncbi:hypothetical protein GCM10009819_07810 [Agromyces tropicus]|uniref:Amidase domain-containing protein n=1 Tax=Agromyces tropicus TaxID=555371 RepID=A0ABP5FHK1_9MICO
MAEPVLPPGVPLELTRSFLRYERALAENDLTVLDELFLDDESTTRTDPDGILVGHAAISAFRARRGGISARALAQVEYRPLAEHVAVMVARSEYAAGGFGTQTQVWVRSESGWRIAVAHVMPRPATIDGTIWRVAGDPLVAGTASGRLVGHRVAVKDVFAVAGNPIGAGNPARLREAAPQQRSADAVVQLTDAGADILGIARTDEFAFSLDGANVHYGTPPNAAAPGALPGGSSSGPASAVALGLADIGLATDTAGSIRVPASYQGIWGIRTTHGTLSTRGLLPLADSFDTVGWLTRDAATLELLADQFAPSRDCSSPTDLVVPVDLLAECEPSVVSAFESFLGVLTASAAVSGIRTIRLGDVDERRETFSLIQSAEAWRHHGDWITRHPGALDSAIEARFRAGAAVTDSEESAARRRMQRLRRRTHAALEHGVLMFPATTGPAPRLGMSGPDVERARVRTLRLTTVAAIAGAPAVSAPLLRVPGTARDEPVGVSFVGSLHHDRPLVQLARAVARALDPQEDQ